MSHPDYSWEKIAYLLDYNINLLNTNKHVASKDFADVMFSHSFPPTITKPTRVTDKSVSVIDNIFYNNFMENTGSLSGILYTDISDPFPVYNIDYSVSVLLLDKSLKKRVYSMASIERFSSAMRERNWDGVLQNGNARNAYTVFYNEFCDVYNTCFIMKILNKVIEPGNHGYRKGWKIQ